MDKKNVTLWLSFFLFLSLSLSLLLIYFFSTSFLSYLFHLLSLALRETHLSWDADGQMFFFYITLLRRVCLRNTNFEEMKIRFDAPSFLINFIIT